ncbi:MAG: GGDEF domain-containing protein [Gammaproteobacteria bacterium]|nr:GGDEF domain-containing protein [Gammaproteobacteria bacterium]
MQMQLNKLFKPQFVENEAEIRHKFIFLSNIYFFACAMAFIMGFIRIRASVVLGAMDFGFSGISLALLLYLRFHIEKIEIVSTIAIGLAFILFYSAYLLAPYNTTRLSLFFLLTASAFFLKGRKKGLMWLVFILLSIVLGHMISYASTEYSHLDIFTTSLYLIALYIVLYNYEIVKEEQQANLELLNMGLEKDIKKRTKELEHANKALKKLSVTDQLTGLYNRYKLEDFFEFEKKKMSRYKTKLAVLLLDVDHFKLVNDKYGHNIGDQVLKEIAHILQAAVRSSDVVVRWGGEEFIILALNITLEQSMQMADHIRQQIKNNVFHDVGCVTVSFGVTSVKEMETLIEVIQHADQALYVAKQSGRDNVKSWE